MKIFAGSFVVLITILFWSGCTGNGGSKKDVSSASDTSTVADTGFTGIKQYMSGTHLVMEETLLNGVKEGIMKSYYANGMLKRTFWYEKGLREDSARWYYEEGQLFRTTPYRKDTVEGIQMQYFRTGRLKAKIGYKKGLRTTFFEEYNPDGKLVTGYPDVVVNIRDDYKTKGTCRVSLSLSDKSTKVRFYRGDLGDGVFDTVRCDKINTLDGIGTINLKKAGSPASGTLDIIAEILTNYGNNFLVQKKIELPYKDLN